MVKFGSLAPLNHDRGERETPDVLDGLGGWPSELVIAQSGACEAHARALAAVRQACSLRAQPGWLSPGNVTPRRHPANSSWQPPDEALVSPVWPPATTGAERA